MFHISTDAVPLLIAEAKKALAERRPGLFDENGVPTEAGVIALYWATADVGAGTVYISTYSSDAPQD
jgi:hypothetical protein